MVVWLGEVCHSPGRHNFLVRVPQQWQVWKVLPAPGCTSSLLGSGHRVACGLLPRQACCVSAQGSVTHLLPRPSSEAG